MIFSLATFTMVHVAISLAAIGTGVVVVYGLIAGKRLDVWTALFLTTTVATSVTGFFFPFERLLPSHILAILSLIVLAPVIVARYNFHLAGAWRQVYVIGSVVALYFNVFVLVAQAFQKVPFLTALASAQSEPPFLVAQAAVLVLAVAAAVVATKRFRTEPARAA